MNKINIKQITKITKDNIYYRDNKGDLAFIVLEPCANSYEASHETLYNSDSAVRCVGNRMFGEYAFYEFYTAEHTQFYMKLKTNKVKRFICRYFGWNFYSKEFQLFYSIQKELIKHGWTTLDLS